MNALGENFVIGEKVGYKRLSLWADDNESLIHTAYYPLIQVNGEMMMIKSEDHVTGAVNAPTLKEARKLAEKERDKLRLQRIYTEADKAKFEFAVRKVGEYEFNPDKDLAKTEYLLRLFPEILRNIDDYQTLAEKWNDGISLLVSNSARAGEKYGESGQDTKSDITYNAVALNEKGKMIYTMYEIISRIVLFSLDGLRDPHEKEIARTLFINGMNPKTAELRMEKGYVGSLYPISETTFYSKRREIIRHVAKTLLITGILDYIILDKSRGRRKAGEFRIKLPGWED